MRSLRALTAALILAACVASASASAAPVQLRVKVVDRTRTVAFVEPGQASGLRVGDEVLIAGRRLKIVDTSKSFAMVELGERLVAIGAEGVVTIPGDRSEASIEPIAPAAPLSAYRDVWGPAVLPASEQTPRAVPLGPIRTASKNRALLRATVSGVVPLDDSGETFFKTEERALVHFEPIHETPFVVDGDVAARTWISGSMSQRDGADSRPVVLVRQLEAGYGSRLSAAAAAGRLRYASSTLGVLDGVRLRTPVLDGFSVAAFGGVVPNPLSNAPELDASRFGGEATYDDPESALRPHAVLGGHVSRFDAAFDERRVHSSVDISPDFGRLGARGELAFFDADNPWDADQVELMNAALDAGATLGPVDLGLSAGVQRPERSRWLASFFPIEWLCIARPDANPPGSCTGSSAAYTGTADVGLRVDKVRFGAGASAARAQDIDSEQLAGFLSVRIQDIVERLRVDAGAMTSRGTLLRTAALTLGPGIELFDGRADLSLRYRPAMTRYFADTGTFIEHAVGESIWFSPVPSLEVSFDGDWITGRDLDVLFLQASIAWRLGM